MNMKEAFANYFAALDVYNNNIYGKKTSIAYSEGLNPALIVSDIDADGEVGWQPRYQGESAVDRKEIERLLGFCLNNELYAYYSTCLFFTMSGKLGDVSLNFEPIMKQDEVEEIIHAQYRDAQNIFPGKRMFVLGNACVDGDDGYFVYYNNETGDLFCYESETVHTVYLPSLIETIGTMEVFD